jgi:hypothetical protein
MKQVLPLSLAEEPKANLIFPLALRCMGLRLRNSQGIAKGVKGVRWPGPWIAIGIGDVSSGKEDWNGECLLNLFNKQQITNNAQCPMPNAQCGNRPLR